MSISKPTKTSSRKRKAPIDDNGERVVLGKKKVSAPPAKKFKPHTESTTSKTAAPSKTFTANLATSAKLVPTRSVSVEIEDVIDKDDHPRSNPPNNPRHILELVDSNDEDNDPPPPAMDVDDDEEEEEEEEEESEEDDDAELGLFPLLVNSL